MASELKVDNISEKTANAGVQLSSSLGFVSKTTSQINALSGMAAGDTVYDSDLGTLKVYNGTSWNGMSSSTFDVTVEYLVIAGGGGAGHDAGGGGGAGGYRNSYSSETSGGNSVTESTLSLSQATGYTVSIGGGGSGSTDTSGSLTSGNDSTFSTITSTGGGRSAKGLEDLAGGNQTGYAGGSGGVWFRPLLSCG